MRTKAFTNWALSLTYSKEYIRDGQVERECLTNDVHSGSLHTMGRDVVLMAIYSRLAQGSDLLESLRRFAFGVMGKKISGPRIKSREIPPAGPDGTDEGGRIPE